MTLPEPHSQITAAAALLRTGGVVAFPTETVYGLGADAANPRAPHLMGHMFHYAPGPNRYGPPAFYELHVWAWKNNPRSDFADWNPTVSCATWEGATF